MNYQLAVNRLEQSGVMDRAQLELARDRIAESRHQADIANKFRMESGMREERGLQLREKALDYEIKSKVDVTLPNGQSLKMDPIQAANFYDKMVDNARQEAVFARQDAQYSNELAGKMTNAFENAIRTDQNGKKLDGSKPEHWNAYDALYAANTSFATNSNIKLPYPGKIPEGKLDIPDGVMKMYQAGLMDDNALLAYMQSKGLIEKIWPDALIEGINTRTVRAVEQMGR